MKGERGKDYGCRAQIVVFPGDRYKIYGQRQNRGSDGETKNRNEQIQEKNRGKDKQMMHIKIWLISCSD